MKEKDWTCEELKTGMDMMQRESVRLIGILESRGLSVAIGKVDTNPRPMSTLFVNGTYITSWVKDDWRTAETALRGIVNLYDHLNREENEVSARLQFEEMQE